MDLTSLCPLRVASLLWQPRPDLWALTLVCKATFDLLPGECVLCKHQEDPNDDDNHLNDDPKRSLVAIRDVIPFKRKADVLLVGSAFAPNRSPVLRLTVRVVVGTLDKRIDVFADRFWAEDGSLREGAPFTKMPLCYERAAWGFENPVGIRPGSASIPNLQPPDSILGKRGDSVKPIGFGPLAPSWPVREKLAPPRVTRNRPDFWIDQPMPAGTNPGYFNAAPHDQQLDGLEGNEPILLENLNRNRSLMATRLPGLKPRVTVERAGRAREDLLVRADTLWIDTDREICTLTWRGQVRLERPDEAGRIVVDLDTSACRASSVNLPRVGPAAVVHDDVESPTTVADLLPGQDRAALADEMARIEQTACPTAPNAGPAMPFVQSQGAISEFLARLPEPGTAPPLTDADPGGTLHLRADEVEAALPLPFQPQALAEAAGRGLSPVPAVQPLTDTHGYDYDARRHRSGSMPAVQPVASPSHADAHGHDASGAESHAAWATPAAAVDDVPPPPLIRSIPKLDTGVNGKNLAVPVPATPMVAVPPALVSPVQKPDSAPSRLKGKDTDGSARPDKRSSAKNNRPRVGSVGANKDKHGDGPSAVGASNAAAEQEPKPAAPVEEVTKKPPPNAVIELLWYDAGALDRIRKRAEWKDYVAPADPPVSGPATKQTDRRDVSHIMSMTKPQSLDSIAEALKHAVDEYGVFAPPLAMLGGDIEFRFDELEELKDTIAAVTPLIGGDKKLKEAVDVASELMKTAWTQGAGSVAETLTARIREAFAQGHRGFPPEYLRMQTDRMLLEQRQFRKRAVSGRPWIWSLLGVGQTTSPIPTYMPVEATGELPMFQRFSTRVIAELCNQLDQYEAHPHALRVVAISRVLSKLPSS